LRTIEWDDSDSSVKMIDQTLLPGELKIIKCKNIAELCEAIQTCEFGALRHSVFAAHSALQWPRS